MKGSGKSHITKLFLLDVLREVESNPHAKLIAYEPKREFYAWLCSLGLKSQITYFMPSDVRSVALDFTRDYPNEQDSQTLANAFYPVEPNETQQFWGDSLRTIYSQLFSAIKGIMGYADLRLMCLVLEDQDLTQKVLGQDPYFVQARELISKQHEGTVGETGSNILKTIHSRIAKMKVLAAQMEYACKANGLFSLRDFVKKPNAGVLVVSKDSDYGLVQDPMNGVIFLRLTQLLDKEQQDPRRKVFIVIDEFPTLAGDKPCPGITDMFLRLRSRGVTVLITYQAHITLKRVYGETAAENIGQCTNVIYLQQPDVESAQYAADDLGKDSGFEKLKSTNYGGGSSGTNGGGSSGNGWNSNWGVSHNQQWFERYHYQPTELLNHLRPASQERGIEGRAKSPEHGPVPWKFTYPPELITRMPRRHPDIAEYIEWEPEAQRLTSLTTDERRALNGEDKIESEEERCIRLLDR